MRHFIFLLAFIIGKEQIFYLSQEFFSNEAVGYFAQGFPQTFQKLVEKKSFMFKYIRSLRRGITLLLSFPNPTLSEEREIISSNAAQDEIMLNYTAEMLENSLGNSLALLPLYIKKQV